MKSKFNQLIMHHQNDKTSSDTEIIIENHEPDLFSLKIHTSINNIIFNGNIPVKKPLMVQELVLKDLSERQLEVLSNMIVKCIERSKEPPKTKQQEIEEVKQMYQIYLEAENVK